MKRNSPASGPSRVFFAGSLFILAAFLVYSNSLHSSFHFDDHLAIIENPAVRNVGDWEALWDAFNQRFLVGLSLAVNYALGGLEPFGYHVFNVLVHALNAVLVYALAVLLLETSLAGLFAGLLFLAHPIQTQAVDYVWQRGTLLVTFFYLACLVSYIRARTRDSKIFYGLSFATGSLGMFCKEIMITAPFILAWYEFCFAGSEKIQKKIKRLTPFFLLCFIVPALLVRVPNLTLDLMKPPAESVIPWGTFLLTEINVVRTYFRLLFWPANQNIDYDYPLAKTLFEPGTFLSLAGIVLILALAVYLFKRRRFLAFCLFSFFLMLSVELVVPQADVLMEHRLYLPMTVFSILMTTVIFDFFKNKRAATVIFLTTAIAVFSFLTYQRNKVWQSEYTLWNDAVQKSPNKARPYNNRGKALNAAGDIVRAREDFEKAANLDPGWAEIDCNLGIVYDRQNDLAKAIEAYTRAIRKKPNYAKAYNNRGADHQILGRHENAIEDLTRAIELKPHYSEAYNNRGISRQLLGRLEEAISDYNAALEQDPQNARAYFNRGAARLARGERDAARADFDRAGKLDPSLIKHI